MPNVTIYTTPACPFCKMAKAFFKEHNIAFEEKDVANDSAMAEEMVKKSGQMAVPVIDIDGELTTGFDKERLSTLLHLQ